MTTIRRKRHKHKSHSKLERRRRKLLFFKIGLVFGILLLIAVGIVFSLKSERINISNIDINGNSALASKVLKRFIEEKISGNYVYVFPKSSILLYPRKNLQLELLDNFKEIKDIDISFKNLQSISVNIEERKPYALYCGNQVSTTTDCYFLDDEGLIFTKAPEFSGNVFFKYYGPVADSKQNIFIGQNFIEKEDFQKISFFLASLTEAGLKPVIFNIMDKNDFEIELESGGKILFGKKQNLSDIYENIQSVFNSEEFGEENLGVLDYADFRFGNKVYFKFK
jgi:hypothetical protein